MTAPTILKASRVRVDREDGRANLVTDINLELRRGEILGLVGESGCGKTTLALALLGYSRRGTQITGGSVTIGDLELLGMDTVALRVVRGRHISYVPQDPGASLNPAVRVGVQMREVLDAHMKGAGRAAREARLREMINEVDLPDDDAFLKRYPHQLSGGQQQRVALAMAFACRPDAVVLDEPTTGLDVTTQAHVIETLRSLCREHGTAAVYVTHDLAVVSQLADRIAVMYAGVVVEIGPCSTLIFKGAHPYTRALIAAIPDPRRRKKHLPRGIPGRVLPPSQRPEGCVFASRCRLVEPECTTNAIPLQEVEADHEVACRRWAVADRIEAVPEAVETAPGSVAEATSAPAHIELTDLSAWYGDTPVFEGVNLQVSKGKCFALVGPSGSGKTTLARCIAGLHPGTTGTIKLSGADLPLAVKERSPEMRRRVQYIFQNPYASLNPRKTVRQLIGQPLRVLRGVQGSALDSEVTALLESVSLDPVLRNRLPSALSGGERQRVAIARALAAQPEILICDEITSALDVSVQAAILGILARLHAETELTVLFITHDLAVVRAIADGVAVMNDGAIVEQGEAGSVLDSPQDPFTEELLAATPAVSAVEHG